MIKWTITTITGFLLTVAMIFGVALATNLYYMQYYSYDAKIARVYSIYAQIIAATGQTQNALPLFVENTAEENAYNDGTKIVIYTGIIDNAASWDEVALVLGHEVAHGNLGHLLKDPPVLWREGMGDNDAIEQLEANADKMGAFYMMSAGYDVCKGRELYKRWQETRGNSLGGDHPDFSYRYEELDVDC